MANPTGNDYATNGFNNIRVSPLWLARSGFISFGSLNSTGFAGSYWSSTVEESDAAYGIYFNPSNVYPTYDSYRFIGYSVRCLVK